MAINFGILQNAPVPQNTTQIIEKPNYALQNEQGLLQGVNSMNSAINEGRRTAIEQANSNSEIQLRNAELNKLNTMLPGELAQQGATLAETKARTQGQGLLNQTSAAQLQQAQRTQSFQRKADAAYQAELKSSGDGQKAIQEYTNALAPEDRQKMQATLDNHAKEVAEGNATQISNAAGIVAAAQTDITQGANPAKLLPYVNAQLDRIDPKHPKLRSLEDLHNYSVITLGTLMNPKTQAQLQMERNKVAPTITKLQQQVQEKKAEYDQMPDKNSPEAVQKKHELDQLNDDIEGEIHGKGVMGQLERNIVEAPINAVKNAVKGVSDYVTRKTAAPIKPVQLPTFNSKEDFQAWYSQQPSDVQQSVQQQLSNQK